MLFQGGDHGGLEDRLRLAEKTETTRWTNKPPTSIPNATAQTPRQRPRPRSPPPRAGVQRQQSRRSQPSEDAEVARWEMRGSEGKGAEFK